MQTDRWAGTFIGKGDLYLWSCISTIIFFLQVLSVLFLLRALYLLFLSMPLCTSPFKRWTQPFMLTTLWWKLSCHCPPVNASEHHHPAGPSRANKATGSLNVCQIWAHPWKIFYTLPLFPGESVCSAPSAIFINTSHLYSKYLFNFKIYIVSFPTASRWYLQKLKT